MENTRLAAYCFASAVGGYITYRVFSPFPNGSSVYIFTVVYFLVFLAVREYRQTVDM